MMVVCTGKKMMMVGRIMAAQVLAREERGKERSGR